MPVFHQIANELLASTSFSIIATSSNSSFPVFAAFPYSMIKKPREVVLSHINSSFAQPSASPRPTTVPAASTLSSIVTPGWPENFFQTHANLLDNILHRLGLEIADLRALEEGRSEQHKCGVARGRRCQPGQTLDLTIEQTGLAGFEAVAR